MASKDNLCEYTHIRGVPNGSEEKNRLQCSAGDAGRHGFDPWVGETYREAGVDFLFIFYKMDCTYLFILCSVFFFPTNIHLKPTI